MKARISDLMNDPVLDHLLSRSSMTRPQFESFLLDQLGSEISSKELTRDEMAELRLVKERVSRGAFNRTLKQGRVNVSESVHTMLLLGYCRMLESPGLGPFVEASDRLRTQVDELRQSSSSDRETFERTVKAMLEELEQAYQALMGLQP